MDHLWTPWRYAYVTGADQKSGCIFCDAPKESDQEARIVHRGAHCYVILNTYPYTNGHVMVVPYAHLDELQNLPVDAAHEMMVLTQRMERWAADANFVSVIGETRVLPETLDVTWDRIRKAFGIGGL